ncbi:MAG: Ig domain-containing protein [Syntrophales bacterium]
MEKKGSPNHTAKPNKATRPEVSKTPLMMSPLVRMREALQLIPYRVLVEVFVLIILIIVALKLPVPKPAGMPITKNLLSSPAESARQAEAELPAQSIPKEETTETKTPPIISAAWITPSQPTTEDVIRVMVKPPEKNPDGPSYIYRWKINGQDVPKAAGDTLRGFPLKIRDQVSVLITPSRDGVQGPSYESPFVVVHSRPMTLEMKALAPVKQGQPIKIQLIATHPEGEQITYSLDAPYLEGMKIDRETGIITWIPANIMSGTVRFGAAVKDEDGNRLTKVFEFQVDLVNRS